MTFEELAEASGSKISDVRSVVYRARYDGKKNFIIGNFWISRHASDAEILEEAERDIKNFVEQHFPDGTSSPKLVNFIKGAVHLYLEE